ncbi:tRNA-modifying protein YgfZ [Shewanella sp. D64]|uniref:tRNA-modifying protein YgfZ n=1 Tax=unclassified Shewanella TaxID=196818 RepID=UPI0022BA3450|nr:MULTISPECIES: tRNA-modifying protein YgfZ [unclassified Shewanella]MEC4724507.1 tRNA-modifying protein YgfZ [Shewanella sp. D64]MEC4736716.1 tRNA-modifying protein YgfZ [Shewanella sp. E94]WBJ94615.1 tRNA-modifying protein YgfZ [Shewanella sp. MTB7]
MTQSVSQPCWNSSEPQAQLIFARLSHMGLMSVTGEQGRSFIHGQITTDVSSLESNQWSWGAHCDPKGKMLACFRTFAVGDALFMMMPLDTLAADLPQLAKYAVFSKADLADVTANWTILGVAGEQAQEWINNYFGEISQALTKIPSGVLLKDGKRFIIVIEKTAAEVLINSINQPIQDQSVWQAQEIQAGLPNIGASHQGQFVPQMCNVQAIDGISFKKGCYMGQETIARMKYRGGNKRALYILSGTSSQPLTLESRLELAIEDDFKKVGAIIELIQSDNQVLFTAVLPNDTENSAVLRVAGDENSSLTIQPLPYSLEEQPLV